MKDRTWTGSQIDRQKNRAKKGKFALQSYEVLNEKSLRQLLSIGWSCVFGKDIENV